ncbi:hypothetical protein [Aeropyrum pernix]|nr:hypothetical protein [Aeropyrum pernix]
MRKRRTHTMKTAYIDTSIILSILLETEKRGPAEQTFEKLSST